MPPSDPNKKAQETRDKHIAKAQSFGDHLRFLLSQPEPAYEWVATVAFYRALHLFNAAYIGNPAKSTQTPNTHKDRNDLIDKTPAYRNKIGRQYHRLFNASLSARYHVDGDFCDVYPQGIVRENLLQGSLNHIESWAKDILKVDLLRDYQR